MHRRELLRLASIAATATSLPRWAWSATLRQRALFPLGVASGTPSPEGVVLWTRLLAGPVPGTVPAGSLSSPLLDALPDALPNALPDALPNALTDALTVRWEVAEDEGFHHIAQAGQAQALAALGHTVHVEVKGLRPGRWYFYRFMHGDAVTPTARTRTAPALEDMPASTRLAFISCQRWEQGHYAAYRHMLEEDLDLVLFLGDYIYEYAMPRQPPPWPLVRTHTLPLATTLEDFRDRYALYRTDPQLQALHRTCPWYVIWDDHEVQDDYAGLSGTGTATDFLRRRNAGYQAFYENMPLPASVLLHGVGGLGQLDAMRIYERHAWGQLMRLHLLDTRQYRDRQACRPAGGRPQAAVTPARCPALLEADRTLLGTEQERWAAQGLAEDATRGVRWSVVAQQTIFSQRNYQALPRERFHTSTWDGYPAGRQRLLDAISAHPPRNTVFLGGDIHQNYVCRVLADFSKPQSAVIASEFCGTSISSRSTVPQSHAQHIASINPHVLLARADKRGYGVAEVTPQRWTTTLRVVDDVAQPDSGISTLATFVVEDGKAGPQSA